MKSIKFSEKEIEFLIEQYTEELANAEKYVQQIKEILKKLGASTKAVKEISVEKETKKNKRKEPVHEVKFSKKKEPKRQGRKSKQEPELMESLSLSEPEKEMEEIISKTMEVKKRGRKPKAVIPFEVSTNDSLNPVIPVEKKKREPKPKKENSVLVEKNPVVKRTSRINQFPELESSPTLSQNTEIDISKKKIGKKTTSKRRNPKGMVTLKRLSKPLPEKIPSYNLGEDHSPNESSPTV